MAFIYDLADTWNNVGTTFTGIKLNVTDTASAAGSLLMDLQVGGSSRFSVRKDGLAVFTDTFNTLTVRIGANKGFGGFSDNAVAIWANSALAALVGRGGGYSGMRIGSDGIFGWSDTATPSSGLDLTLFRDAANTLAQRNGVNAQAFNLYNTYTDASNYERGEIGWVSNVFVIRPRSLGTGTERQIDIRNAGGNSVLLTSGGAVILGNGISTDIRLFSGNIYPGTTDGTIGLGVTTNSWGNFFQGAAYHEMREMAAPAAPATNRVRIYAEDNGAGKTRLMALFPTGVAQQIAIEP